MKVLQLTAHFHPNLGGVETHLNDLVAELQKQGIGVFVLAYVPLTTRAKYKLYEREKNLTILRIPWIKGFFYKLVNHPMLEFVYLLPGLFIITPFVLLIYRPQVIHSHGLVAGTVGVFWGKVFRQRVIVTTHSIYHFPKSGLYHNYVHWLFNNADHILVLSRQSKKELEVLGVPGEKISVFTYWVDQERFRPMDKEEQKIKFSLGSSFTVLFVGRLIEEKGILVLLDAFNQIKDDIILLIAGDGPLRGVVEIYTNNNPHIKYAGRVDQSKLSFLYNAADVLVVPSIHEEGFGRIIIESLSCGTPVIASRRGGIVEAMDGSVGELIDMSATRLKKTMEYFYENPVQLLNKAKNCSAFAVANFSSKNSQIIINTYER